MIDFDPLVQLASRLRQRKRPVFLVGRFRSGTTALWNLFRQSPEALAMYEPLHEALPAHLEWPGPPDPTHRGVSDYFRELREQRAAVARHHRPEFGTTRLLMAGNEAHPELKTYLKVLVGLAGAKVPVIKCVRLDFRLAWLRKNFPDAAIIYLHRNPREQWLSMAAKEDAKLRDARWLGVYQSNTFAANLLFSLPEVMESAAQHPYERAYYLGRVSRAVAEKYADVAVDFDEEFIKGDAGVFERLAKLAGVPIPPEVVAAQLARDIAQRATVEQTDIPFAKMEERCEAVLERRGLLRAIKDGALETAWPAAADLTRAQMQEAVDCLSLAQARDQLRNVQANAELAQSREVLRVALNRVAALEDDLERAAKGQIVVPPPSLS